MRAVLLVALLLLGLSASFGQQTGAGASRTLNTRPFTEVTGKQIEVEPSEFEFSASGFKYTISSRGRAKREGVGDSSGRVRRFDLRLSRGDVLERAIYHAEYRGDLLLLCQVGDGESGAGFITRLDGRTLAMKWKRSIPGFNVGQGLIENDHAYVTAIGFVGKVNLPTGGYAWRHSNLYRTSPKRVNGYLDDDFNMFKLPKIEGDAVLFEEIDPYPIPVKTLKVQKQSGRILSIK